ncbi:MAG: hypothetical protein U0Y82_04245 [Thermoleophilia bacterium]
MTTNGPDPRAAARGFIALVLDQARIDPDRRPSADMRRWCSDLSVRLGIPPRDEFETNRDLLREALRLEQVAHMNHPTESAPPVRAIAELPV